jgi:SP family sugar:H+ symporter-like MFS transporter
VYEIVDELQYTIKAENEGGKATWAECFSTCNALWKRTVNGMVLQFVQQLHGQNFYCAYPSSRTKITELRRFVSDYYGDTFFESAGMELSPYVI